MPEVPVRSPYKEKGTPAQRATFFNTTSDRRTSSTTAAPRPKP